MKHMILPLFCLFIFNVFSQYDFSYSSTEWRHSHFFDYYLKDITLEQKKEIKEITISTTSKKKNFTERNVLNENGQVIEKTGLGKYNFATEVRYNTAGKMTFLQHKEKNQIKYAFIRKYDQQNRALEKTTQGKNGKFKRKQIKTYADGDCPITHDFYSKSPNTPKSSWEYTYFSDCDKKQSVLKNKKGKIKRTITFDCKKEGEVLNPKKNLTQVCKWDEEDEKYLYKITQGFDEKGNITKKVEKFNITDTSIAERTTYDKNGFVSMRTTYLMSAEGILTKTTETYKKDQVYKKNITVTKSTNELMNPKLPQLLSEKRYKKGKVIYEEFKTYNGDLLTLSKQSRKGKIISTKTYEYKNGLLTHQTNQYKKKNPTRTELEYNSDGLVGLITNFDLKGKQSSQVAYTYIMKK